jgi:glycosyltransferase involved in cell wall biosynthesis
MKLTEKHIIILGTAKFDGLYQSTSFTIAKHLAKNNFVYYVDYPFTWKDYFNLKGTDEFKRRQKKFSSSSDGIIETSIPNLKVVITPPVYSINFLPEGKLYRNALKFNERIIVKRIEQLIKKFRIKDFIYINSFNFHYPGIADHIKPELTVYYCVDPMIIPYDMKHGIVSEEILVRSSDLVICTSKQLYLEKKEQNKNTFFIPNAADIEHSSKALDKTLKAHPLIEHLPKPVIGYFGNIERRMDFDLLKEVVENNKDKNFVFAGPISPEFVPEWFYNRENIHLVGKIPYNEMPSMIKGFDVALIPFKKDDVSKTIFPLKLFEYLGAGKPVVATDFNPDLEEFTESTVSYCSDANTFSDALNVALNSSEQTMFDERIEVAKKNTWDVRTETITELLQKYLSKQNSEVVVE